MNDTVVYWIHLTSESDITTEGYVGVSCQFDERLKNHKLGFGNKNVKYHFTQTPDDVVVEIVLEGDEASCYTYEQSLRPKPRVGWNIAEGGSKPPSPKGDKVRAAKAAASLKGRTITWGDKISQSLTGKTLSPAHVLKRSETRKSMNLTAWNKGIKTGPQSDEVKQKRSKAMMGKGTRQVRTPLGVFDSINEAAVAHGVQHATLHARIKYYKMEGYEYVE